MFCTKCGAKIEEGAAFCSNCGNAAGGQQKSVYNQGASMQGQPVAGQSMQGQMPQWQTMPNPGMFPEKSGMKPKMSKKKLGIIIGAAAGAVVLIAAIIIAIVALSGSRGRSYEAVIDQYVNARMSGDIEDFVAVFHEGEVDLAMENYGYALDEKEQFLEDGQEIMDLSMEEAENEDGIFGGSWSYDYEINDTRNISGDDLETIQASYDRLADLEVSEAMEVDLTIHIQGKDGENMDISDGYLLLIQVDGSWYVNMGPAMSVPWDSLEMLE